jgi:hypothetical protein
MLNALNTLMSLALSAFAGWAVMSPCVRDGIVIKIGLALVSLGFLGAFFLGVEPAGAGPLVFAHALISLGLLICAAGYLWRTRAQRSRMAHRRATDWLETR